MINLSGTGRFFYGTAITGMGVQAIYCHDLPYIISLPEHFWVPANEVFAIIWGIVFIMAGACILFKKQARQVSLIFGGVLTLIFFLYYIPYQLLTSANYMHLADWENAEKELALAGGAFVIAGYFSAKNESPIAGFLAKLVTPGGIAFALTIISFGILHFMEATDAATLVPAWIPGHLFWIYFCGAALICSGISVIFKIKTRIIAALLGTMIFIWFIILHIPRVIAAPAADIEGEITSAFLALAYSGTAFAIAGQAMLRGKSAKHKLSDQS